MEEFLTQLLQAVVIAAVSVCSAYLVRLINKKSELSQEEIKNQKAKELLKAVTDAVTTAVAYTSQTYVDALKKNGIFDAEAQAKALEKSLNMALSLLTPAAKKALEELYGNLTMYLTSKIEAEVRIQKGAPPVTVVNNVVAPAEAAVATAVN